MATVTTVCISTKERNVIVVGKTGGGKSTVANMILETKSKDPPFKISDSNVADSATTEAQAAMGVLQTTGEHHYSVKVVDTVGFFDTKGMSNKQVINDTKQFIKDQVPIGLNLVLFIYKNGRWTRDEQETFNFITKHFKEEVSAISALIVTGCDGFSDTQKQAIIDEFKDSKPDIANFMQKGIYPVGFPDLSKLKESLREPYKADMKADQETLRALIYSCDELKLRREILGETIWEKAAQIGCTIL